MLMQFDTVLLVYNFVNRFVKRPLFHDELGKLVSACRAALGSTAAGDDCAEC